MEVKRPVTLLNVGHVEQTPEEEYVRNVMKPTEPYACAWHDVKPEHFIVPDERLTSKTTLIYLIAGSY